MVISIGTVILNPEFLKVVDQEIEANILVLEDDRDIRHMLSALLESEGFRVSCAADGVTGMAAISPETDLLILDIEMPFKSGFEVLKELRQTNALPVLILSSRSGGEDRVSGLNLGADDYLVKPFIPEELIARVRALLRRVPGSKTALVPTKGLQFNEDIGRAYLDGEPLDLTRREYDLLNVLTGAPGRNFSRDELVERVWGLDSDVTTRQVDLVVSKIRSKLKKKGRTDLIRSVWGVGYRLDVD